MTSLFSKLSNIVYNSCPGALFTEDVLDYETSPLLEIRVRATDSLSGATADTLVTVVLTDANDCVPTFLESVYNVSLLESTAPGTLIARIEAFDNDTGDYFILICCVYV